MLMPALSVVVVLVACFGILLHHRFLRMMRSRHPSVWHATGQPTLFSIGGSLIMSMPLLRFLWCKAYERVDDEEFVRLGAVVRTYNLVFFCLFTGFAILSFTRM